MALIRIDHRCDARTVGRKQFFAEYSRLADRLEKEGLHVSEFLSAVETLRWGAQEKSS